MTGGTYIIPRNGKAILYVNGRQHHEMGHGCVDASTSPDGKKILLVYPNKMEVMNIDSQGSPSNLQIWGGVSKGFKTGRFVDAAGTTVIASDGTSTYEIIGGHIVNIF